MSDLNLKRKLWLNENNDTGLTSSYVEINCRLFDDSYLDDFIDKKAIETAMSNDLILESDRLRILLNDYREKKNDQEIISDPRWLKVVNQAQIVIITWNDML